MKVLAFALSLAVASPAFAAAPTLEVAQAWSRPAVAGGTGGGYFVLANHGKAADALIKVESSAAREVQIHQSSMAGGMASMKPVAKLALPPGASVTFAPGGYHLMFLGLRKPLNPGDTLPATFTFASGAKVQATFRVQVTPPAATHSHP